MDVNDTDLHDVILTFVLLLNTHTSVVHGVLWGTEASGLSRYCMLRSDC